MVLVHRNTDGSGIVISEIDRSTYMTDSTDFGLMKMAMG